MYYKYNDIDIYYEVKGTTDPIVFLHGWGSSLNTFNKQVSYFEKTNKLYLLDFPGFGMSDEIEEDFKLDDYVDLLDKFIKDLDIINPIIIAHSFGGRVLIKYALNHKVKACVFIGSAGIKHYKIKTKFKILKYKIKKKYYKLTKNYLKYNLLIKNSGSNDYLMLSDKMKTVMNNVLKINLKKDLKKIKTKTLLIWGKYDKITPVSDAFIFKKKIKESSLYLLNGTHFVHNEKAEEVNEIIERFISDLVE